jgi:hypothetical protein
VATRTITPFLRQEDPSEPEERTQEWLSDVQPLNAIERDLVRLVTIAGYYFKLVFNSTYSDLLLV